MTIMTPTQQKRDAVLGICEKYVQLFAIGKVPYAESPAGSNNVYFNTEFYGVAVRNGYNLKGQPDKTASWAWCGTSSSIIYFESGSPLGIIDYRKGFAGCPYAVRNISKWGVEVSFADAKPADVVFYDFDGNGSWDHTGILKLKTGVLTEMHVYEGNTSFTTSKDLAEIKRANANGGNYLLRPDRHYLAGRVKIVRPNCLG